MHSKKADRPMLHYCSTLKEMRNRETCEKGVKGMKDIQASKKVLRDKDMK
jgi:predicted nucleic acid binding AN1-type Zn finger protein